MPLPKAPTKMGGVLKGESNRKTQTRKKLKKKPTDASKSSKQKTSSSDTASVTTLHVQIPSELQSEYESYLDCCYALGVEPNARRFLRYNELYPYK